MERPPLSPSTLTRRDVLRTGLAGVAWLLLPNTVVQDSGEDDPHGVNARLKYLMEAQLPHVTHRTHLIVPSASRGVVHLPDIHQCNATTKEDKRQVEQSQLEIAELIQALCRDERVKLKILFDEALLAEGEPPLPERPAHLTVQRRQLSLSNRALLGAATYVANQGLVEERGAEKTATFAPVWDAWDKPDWKKIVFDDREDAFLQIACAEAPGSVCYVVFGCSHDWKNNVETWNKEHPREKFSLVTLYTQEIHTQLVQQGILPSPDPSLTVMEEQQ